MFQLGVETVAGVPTVRVKGEIGILEVPQFRACLRKLAEESHETVVIDGSDVTHIYSEGLGAMVELAVTVKQRGGQVILRNPSARLARLLNATSLDRLLTIEGPADDA